SLRPSAIGLCVEIEECNLGRRRQGETCVTRGGGAADDRGAERHEGKLVLHGGTLLDRRSVAESMAIGRSMSWMRDACQAGNGPAKRVCRCPACDQKIALGQVLAAQVDPSCRRGVVRIRSGRDNKSTA